MAGKRDRNQSYNVHGTGVTSLGHGFDQIGMPDYRRAAATEIVRDVLTANGALDFYWYVPLSTPEVCCYWDDAEQNQLWITASEVHVVKEDPRVQRPARPLTYSKHDGDYVGWLLPGGQSGSGGGQPKVEHPYVVCPVEFQRVPAGIPCSYCDVIHELP